MAQRNDKRVDAEHRAAEWLAKANAAAERGDHASAEYAYDKAQYWQDRMNALLGNA